MSNAIVGIHNMINGYKFTWCERVGWGEANFKSEITVFTCNTKHGNYLVPWKSRTFHFQKQTRKTNKQKDTQQNQVK